MAANIIFEYPATVAVANASNTETNPVGRRFLYPLVSALPMDVGTAL